jgi:hypothetical protein
MHLRTGGLAKDQILFFTVHSVSMMIEVEAIDEPSCGRLGVDVPGGGHFSCIAFELEIDFERKVIGEITLSHSSIK